MNKIYYILPILIFGFTNFVSAQELDSDGDGLSNKEELTVYFTNPNNPDSDGDGYNDNLEIKHGYSPRIPLPKKNTEIDSDADGLNDDLELKLKTNIMSDDTDDDGYSDFKEVFYGYNPLKNKGDNSLPRKVKVNVEKQTLGYYLNSVLIKKYPVSTGRPSAPSPNGEFTIQRKLPTHTYPRITGGYFTNVKWNLQFKPHYYIHSAYWHNDFGKKARSGGCINLREEDAKVIYDILRIGDKVIISGKTPANGLVK